MFKLWHGDCLELMKDIPDGSIDAVICDPPYGTTQCKWDSVINLDAMWQELRRVIKPNGAIVMTASQPFTTKLISSNLEQFKYCWYWRKNRATGVFNAKKQPLREVEEVCVFNVKQYNPQGLIETNEPSRNSRKDSEVYGKGKNKTYIRKYTNYPKQVLEFDVVQRPQHSTQKPVELMEYLIKTYTNEGDTVLDLTMGSGSTGVACAKTNRGFIGIELDRDYYDIAVNRINEAKEAANGNISQE